MKRIKFVILIFLFVNGNSVPIKDSDKTDENDSSGSIFDFSGLHDLLNSFTGFLDYEDSEEDKIVVCRNCTVIVNCQDCNKTETTTTTTRPNKTPIVTVPPTTQDRSTTTTTQPSTSSTTEQE